MIDLIFFLYIHYPVIDLIFFLYPFLDWTLFKSSTELCNFFLDTHWLMELFSSLLDNMLRLAYRYRNIFYCTLYWHDLV